jgi:2-dehydro-3-deoxygluconokinase
MQPADLPAELFQAGRSKLLHLTGITPALGSQAAATARQALELARSAGWLFSFDLNYRSKLWTTAQAAEGCDFFARAANLLIAPVGDARLIYGLPAQTGPEKVLDELANRYPQATVVLTLGKDGALGHEPGGYTIHQPIFPAEEVGRIGGGDAFAAGLLYGYLQAEEGQDRLAMALRWGAAVAALKYSTPGDMPIINRQEVARLVNQDLAGPSITR